MSNTSNKEITFDSLDDVKSYCNTKIETTRASIIKTLRKKLIGKYFVFSYQNSKTHWTYFGKITKLNLQKGTFKEVILEYEDRHGVHEKYHFFLGGGFLVYAARFFDDESSAMLFAEAAN